MTGYARGGTRTRLRSTTTEETRTLDATQAPETRRPSRAKTALVCALVLLAAAGLAALALVTEPAARRGGATKESAMLVEVATVVQGTFRPTVVATGTVQPEQDIVLQPRVSGEVIARAPQFTPGGLVQRGDLLLRIQPADYRTVLAQRRSELRQALSELDIEMGRQRVAREEYALFDDRAPSGEKSLMLRKPQLEAAQVRIEAAKAAVAQAKLDLRRTTIRAPFDAQVLRRDASVGSQVGPGDSLGRLVGIDTYWVVTTVPLETLRWLPITDGGAEEGAEVRIHNPATWSKGSYRVGRLTKLIGALDEGTRMARLIVSVPDPLAREREAAHGPPLIIGEFVEAHIRGREITDVVALNRSYLRDGDTVWVADNGRLRLQDVEIVFRDASHAYIKSGLERDDQVITTNLATVTEGARLRVKREQKQEQARQAHQEEHTSR